MKPIRALILLAITTFLIFTFDVRSTGATMDYSKQTLIEEDFSGKDLRGLTFNLANLKKSNLSNTNLQGASLFGAKLQEANLSGANLKDATLDSAVFDDTDLSNAILEDSFAFNTHFANVNINGADFTNVIFRDDVLDILCESASGENPVTGRLTRETLEC